MHHLLHASSSLEIYQFLEKKNLLDNSSHYWWPNAGSFEVVIGAILTQNTTWKNVEKSLGHLKGYLELDTFLQLNEDSLKELIRPSGFYNQKAPRLLQITKNIKEDFETFEYFQKEVSREWLMQQKGIGEESTDAILSYACFRAEMVVDSYTKRLLRFFGKEFKNYGEYKSFLEFGIREKFKEEELAFTFMKFHGMIVEYNKRGFLKNS